MISQVDISNIEDMVDVASVTPADFLWAGLALLIGAILGRIARASIRRYGKKANIAPNVIDLLGTMSLWTIFAIAVFIALSFVGFTIAPLWVFILLVAGVFIIGGRTLLENFGAGILLQARAPFEPGDQVRLGEFVGQVREVNSRVVLLETIDNRTVFFPNVEALKSPIVNLTDSADRMSELTFDIEYGSDLDIAKRSILTSLTACAAVLADPKPEVEVRSFEESSVRLILRFWHPSDILSEWAATDEAARAGYKALYEADITFAFPQRTLWWGADEPES
ncbi:MAG: mechanosensitive ion channel family protein [Acidimicrobiia bacterium]